MAPRASHPRRPARRTVLRAAAPAAVAAGGLLATGSAGAVGAAGTARAAGEPDPDLPPVPGMHGDRRANELWYRFDEATAYHPSQEFTDAWYELVAGYGNQWDRTLLQAWRGMALADQAAYEESFTRFVEPAAEALAVISRVQLAVFDSVYHPDDPRLVQAFADFAQGVLYDPRHDGLHIMTGHPPIGYPFWHVVMRAMVFLDVDAARWERMAPLNGFAYAVQTRADPDQEALNEPLPPEVVARLAAEWLPRDLHQLDEVFLDFPYPDHPPQQPGA